MLVTLVLVGGGRDKRIDSQVLQASLLHVQRDSANETRKGVMGQLKFPLVSSQAYMGAYTCAHTCITHTHKLRTIMLVYLASLKAMYE